MSVYHILYNPLSGNGSGEERSRKLIGILQDKEHDYKDITKIDDMKAYIASMGEDDSIVICGGDGTLNRFANSIDRDELRHTIYFFPAGSGNDFFNDIDAKDPDMPICINRYLANLPTIFVKGKQMKFLNGIGYGLDGYVCEEGDKVRGKSDKPVNYTSIALKGLAYDFKPVNAEVTVDGVIHQYSKVWLAPTMNGRYFGGGMMMAPMQDRLNKAHTVSVVVVHDAYNFQLLPLFPLIFKGKHIKHKRFVQPFAAHSVRVKFDRPIALQVDGETISNVLEYEVTTES